MVSGGCSTVLLAREVVTVGVGLGGVAAYGWGLDGAGNGREAAWGLRSEDCRDHEVFDCSLGQASSMEEIMPSGAIMVNHHLLFPYEHLRDF